MAWTGHERHLIKDFNLPHQRLHSIPNPIDDILIIPYDPATVPPIRRGHLTTATDIDPGLFPDSICLCFGGTNELIAFLFC